MPASIRWSYSADAMFTAHDAQPYVRADRPTAVLLGPLVAALLGGRSTHSLGGRKRAWSMSTDDSQRSHTEYEYEPFELIFLRRREEILKLVGLAGYALRALEGSARLTEVLKKPADAVERAREIEALAQAEVKADLPLLHALLRS